MADLTLADLHARLQHDIEHAEAALIRDGLLAPFVALTTSDGTLVPIVPDFSSAETKAASMTAVRLLAIAEDAVLATHMSEVWMVVGQPIPDVSPSESERRIEAVAVVVQGRVQGEVISLSSVRGILRGNDGRPTGLRGLGLPGKEGMAPRRARWRSFCHRRSRLRCRGWSLARLPCGCGCCPPPNERTSYGVDRGQNR